MNDQALNTIPLFASLSGRERRAVAQRADEVDLPAGKTLIGEGEFSHEFFAIIHGVAEVRHGGEVIAERGPGDFVGEMGILTHGRRNATVVADSDMELVVLGQREFAGLIDEVPGFARKLLAGMAHRLREADSKNVQ